MVEGESQQLLPSFGTYTDAIITILAELMTINDMICEDLIRVQKHHMRSHQTNNGKQYKLRQKSTERNTSVKYSSGLRTSSRAGTLVSSHNADGTSDSASNDATW